jgi:hypothetical protein
VEAWPVGGTLVGDGEGERRQPEAAGHLALLYFFSHPPSTGAEKREGAQRVGEGRGAGWVGIREGNDVDG